MAACTLPSNSNLPQTLKRQNISKQRNYYQDKSVPTTFHGGILSKLPTQAWE